MNRRGFLGLVCSGLAATLVATHLPLSILPKAIQRKGALDFLTQAWRAEVKGKSIGTQPRQIIVGRDLYEAFEDEIVTIRRFTNNEQVLPGLRFKSLRLTYEGRGWNIVRFVY